jgi:hypothetical protein
LLLLLLLLLILNELTPRQRIERYFRMLSVLGGRRADAAVNVDDLSKIGTKRARSARHTGLLQRH